MQHYIWVEIVVLWLEINQVYDGIHTHKIKICKVTAVHPRTIFVTVYDDG